MKVLQVLVLILGLFYVVDAQDGRQLTTLTGVVTDQAGAGIEDTKIILTNAKGYSFDAFTNEYGTYRISIPAGTYSINAEYTKHRGWEKFNVEKFEIASKEKINLDITLRIDEEFIKKFSSPVHSLGKTSEGKKEIIKNISILSGTIYDANGAIVVNAKVTAVSKKGEKYEAFANDDGIYWLNLPFNKYDTESASSFREAKYDIIVEMDGFKRSVTNDFVFVPSQFGKLQLDIALEVAGIVSH